MVVLQKQTSFGTLNARPKNTVDLMDQKKSSGAEDLENRFQHLTSIIASQWSIGSVIPEASLSHFVFEEKVAFLPLGINDGLSSHFIRSHTRYHIVPRLATRIQN